jgi:hypothetical protein
MLVQVVSLLAAMSTPALWLLGVSWENGLIAAGIWLGVGIFAAVWHRNIIADNFIPPVDQPEVEEYVSRTVREEAELEDLVRTANKAVQVSENLASQKTVLEFEVDRLRQQLEDERRFMGDH